MRRWLAKWFVERENLAGATSLSAIGAGAIDRFKVAPFGDLETVVESLRELS